VANANVFAQISPPVLRSKGIVSVNIVSANTIKNQIVVIGQLLPITVSQIKNALAILPEAKEIVIDSIGGNTESAIEIATMIRDRNLTLVVDGRCFSACANFIFVAAKHKRVLQGSLVGIHETSFHYVENNSERKVSGNETQSALTTSQDTEGLKYFEKTQTAIQNFYKQFNIQQYYFQIFASYVTTRKQLIGIENIDEVNGYPGCPRIVMWALDEKKLKKMGINGIDEFWFPKNNLEEKFLYANFKMLPDSIYFGELQELSNFCKGFTNTWILRQWYRLPFTNLN
jgi:ATP-dependent protease ClpP protease subunit